MDFVQSAGTLQRNFLRHGFGLYQNQDRNRHEIQARLQNIWGTHTLKYGFEYNDNIYNIEQQSTGPNQTFSDPLGLIPAGSGINQVNGYRVTNNMAVCTQRAAQIVCPAGSSTNILTPAVAASAIPGVTSVVTGTITADEALNHPFLVRTSARSVTSNSMLKQTVELKVSISRMTTESPTTCRSTMVFAGTISSHWATTAFTT